MNSVSGETFATINPATEQEICQVSRADSADVDLAVAAARHALEKGEWSKYQNPDRRDFMLKFADNL